MRERARERERERKRERAAQLESLSHQMKASEQLVKPDQATGFQISEFVAANEKNVSMQRSLPVSDGVRIMKQMYHLDCSRGKKLTGTKFSDTLHVFV